MKKSVTKILMGAVFVMVAVSSCKKDEATNPCAYTKVNDGTYKLTTVGKITTVQNLMADTIVGVSMTGQPVGTGKFTFFSLETGAIIPNSDSATNKWDIAFRGTTILTNNGSSGPGLGGAYVQVGLFNDIASVSLDSTVRVDAGSVRAIKTGSNDGWYVYDATNNLVSPISGRVIIIRTATGKYAKLEINNYYKGGTTPTICTAAAIKSSEQRYYTFKYTYQPNGSTTF
jgi:hypothetical protein